MNSIPSQRQAQLSSPSQALPPILGFSYVLTVMLTLLLGCVNKTLGIGFTIVGIILDVFLTNLTMVSADEDVLLLKCSVLLHMNISKKMLLRSVIGWTDDNSPFLDRRDSKHLLCMMKQCVKHSTYILFKISEGNRILKLCATQMTLWFKVSSRELKSLAYSILNLRAPNQPFSIHLSLLFWIG